MSFYRLEELFPDDLAKRIAEVPILILPLGTIEWHSHHLPVGLDGIVAEALCERIADSADAVLAPVSFWAAGGVPYPYTLNLPMDMVERLFVEVFEQFATFGFLVIVGFTGHFGLDQTLALKRAALTVMHRTSATLWPCTEYDLTTDVGYSGDHAAVGETSLMMALRPELVRLNTIPSERSLDGIIGEDPRGRASADYADHLIRIISSRAAEVATRLLRRTSASEREDFIQAIAAGVRVLERTAQERQIRPKKDVPSIVTPAYRSYCQAIFQGDYRHAQACAEKKLATLSE